MAIPPGLHADPLDQLTRTRDKHKAPSSTPPHPLSLQDGFRLLLHSVGKIHQAIFSAISNRRSSTMLFTNATIITMNPTRAIITGGAIAIKDNRIAAVGKTDALLRQYSGDQIIDVKGKLIIPGLIDTHVHLAQALIRGCADDMALLQWLCDRVWVLQGSYTHEDAYVSARLCIAEMLR